MPDLTARDLIKQGYTPEHAASYIARFADPPAVSPSDPELPPPNFYPSDRRLIDAVAQPPAVPTPRNGTRRKSSTRPALPPVSEASPAVIRAWAADAGVTVAAKGRIAVSVLQAYERARSEGARV